MYPERLAVKMGDHALTYDELNRTANRIARAIASRRGILNEPIVLLFEHGVDVIPAILGALKAGKCFSLADVSSPLESLAAILEDSQAGLIVTNRHGAKIVRGLAQESQRWLNISEMDDSFSPANLGLTLSPDSLGYLIYTSGSTGKPKGVIQNHRNILHGTMRRINAFRICPQDRLTLLSSGSHQAIMNIFSAVLSGAAICPFNAKEHGPTRFAAWLQSEGITIYHSSASLFRQLVATLTGDEELSTIRLVRSASEATSKSDVELYRKHFSDDCLFSNGLGSTETGTSVLYFTDKSTPIVSETVPIGFPLDDMEILVVDDDGREVGINCVGEIAVKSRYLALGYWRRHELTQEKFRPAPRAADKKIYFTGDLGRISQAGCVEHLGRKDLQVKVRGHRVETAEVETMIAEHPKIKQAAVVGRERQPGEMQLVAYLVSATKPPPTVSELREFLTVKLPNHMIPTAVVFLEVLPLAPNGKLDRKALPAPGNARPELDTPLIAPKTAIEKQLAQIWEEVIDLRPVGIQDNFFDLGGHSLAASRIISRILKTFELDLPIKALFDSPTVADMAVVITQNQANRASPEDLARLLSEVETLSEEEAQRLLAAERPT
jgi:amino acid adenylation domain-containing protein